VHGRAHRSSAARGPPSLQVLAVPREKARVSSQSRPRTRAGRVPLFAARHCFPTAGCAAQLAIITSRIMRTALSIAGSDPSGGAGLQADLQVFRSLGVRGAGVVTALTVQDSRKVHQVLPVFPSVVLDQLRVLLRDQQPDAVKIGMLGSDDVVRNVALGLCELAAGTPIVIDPVLRASDGSFLLERRAWGSLSGLFGGATLVTPNLAEAQALTGCDAFTHKGCEEAARYFLGELGASAVLIKGGHREGAPDDLLALQSGDTTRLSWLKGERIASEPVHGTGCALSSAIAAKLAVGTELELAVAEARSYVAVGIRNAVPVGSGARFLGPA
jgi:hydroxymethylpyrimidine/phosphomethylpyrimidine kinase